MPIFTVITATWNRSHHIIPAIRSVLAQTCTDFEYLIIGDCCTDDTEEIVKPFLSDRVRWLSTSERWKSQAGPNNMGIEQSRSEYIAYIGHDDIWAPDHLAAHFQVLQRPAKPDFSVAGYVSHGCAGTGIVAVRGLFRENDRLESYLFAPSCLAHRRGVTDRIGSWRKPDEIEEGVDTDLLVRASAAAMRFVPTGKVTVHKFEAAQRYLSYLEHESGEQDQILARMAEPGFDSQIAAWIEQSKAQGTFAPSYVTWKVNRPKSGIAAYFRESRGLTVPALTALNQRFELLQAVRPGASDWSHSGPDDNGFMWTGPNPAPRMLIPVTADKPVALNFSMLHADVAVLHALRFAINEKHVTHDIIRTSRAEGRFRADVRILCTLHSDRPSVLRIFHPQGAMIGETLALRRGVAVGPVVISDHPTSLLKELTSRTWQALREIAGDLLSVLPVAARRKNP